MNTTPGFEIDYIHVGEEGRSGDAIALRFGNLYGPRNQQTVMVIDGGTLESGQTLVNHIGQYYGTDKVDYVVSTHQDSDHTSGLKIVLEKLFVDNLLMHIPWEHEEQIDSLFEGDFKDGELESELQKSLENIRDIEEIALNKEIPITEPFEGLYTTDGCMHVLGPSKDFYESLIPQFRETPNAKDSISLAFEQIFSKADEAISFIIETLDPATETLTDEGRFAPENESSIILLLNIGGEKILFTGDAGITSLTYAADYAEGMSFNLTDLHLLHVPHHGSKQNVGPTILNRIKAKKSQISAALKGAPKHPSKKVINALIRRNSDVYVTKGGIICHSHNAPDRLNWGPVQAELFNSQVEDD